MAGVHGARGDARRDSEAHGARTRQTRLCLSVLVRARQTGERALRGPATTVRIQGWGGRQGLRWGECAPSSSYPQV